MAYSLQDVRRSYTAEKAWAEMMGELPAYLLYRPLSFYITKWLLNLRVPILAVTLLAGSIPVPMLALAWRGDPEAYLLIAVLGFLYHVLDCVDGNMARTTGRITTFGALADNLVGFIFWCSLFVSLGLLVEHSHPQWLGSYGLELSMGCAILVLLNRQTRDVYTLLHQKTPLVDYSPRPRLSARQGMYAALVGLENLYIFAIILGGLYNALHWVLIGVAIYVTAMFVGAMTITFFKAYKQDHHGSVQH